MHKKVVAVIGTNHNALDILRSVPKGHRAILFGELTPELKDEAYLLGVAAYQLRSEKDFGKVFDKFFGNLTERKVFAIMNLEDDKKSLLYVKQLHKLIDSTERERRYFCPLCKGVEWAHPLRQPS